MVFNGHSGTEGPAIFGRSENDCDQVSSSTLSQCRSNLTHHIDVENIKRRSVEENARYSIVNVEVNVIKRFGHFALVVLSVNSQPGSVDLFLRLGLSGKWHNSVSPFSPATQLDQQSAQIIETKDGEIDQIARLLFRHSSIEELSRDSHVI
jgi:hypothetical protein